MVYGLFEYQGRSRRDKAAYFLIPLRKSLLNVVRWAFYTATWASLMNHETSPTERTVFVNVLKAHIAMMILWLAHGLGIGVAKAIALRFYTSNFFDRMQVHRPFHLSSRVALSSVLPVSF